MERSGLTSRVFGRPIFSHLKAEGGQGGVGQRHGGAPEPRHVRDTTIQEMQLKGLAHE